MDDTTKIMTIWTKGNFKAHSFIDKDYWLENFNRVKNEYLLKSETFVYEEQKEIKGFISILNNNYIGALFVKNEYKRNGIGRKLINFVKENYDKLTLNVYDKNGEALAFYVAMGFKNKGISIDKETNEKEYTMEWENTEKI